MGKLTQPWSSRKIFWKRETHSESERLSKIIETKLKVGGDEAVVVRVEFQDEEFGFILKTVGESMKGYKQGKDTQIWILQRSL